ncbi:MAG: STAS domain-containing protein, partial [Chthoniobacteraceae bacterium]
RVLVDCAELDYVNSAGLKVLLIAAKKLEALDGNFALCTLTPGVLMVFEMIGFNRIMKIAVTRDDALQILRAPS